MSRTRPWAVTWCAGEAGELHERPLSAGSGRRVEVLEVRSPALVLGSTQQESTVDAEALTAAGVALVRRRSGGGAVLLQPGAATWVDVTISRDDPFWADDVGVAFHWLGRAWMQAVALLGVEAAVHTGPPVESPWSRRVCFAGLGSGEVSSSGRKLVGISQRRTREATRFQCVVHRMWDPGPILGFLAVGDEERAAGAAALAGVATGIDLPQDALVAALVSALPD